MRAGIIALFIVLLLTPCVYAEEKFGLVFYVEGGVTLMRAGINTSLNKTEHIVYPVREGDKIITGDSGRALIVSYKKNRGYEMAPKSEVFIYKGDVAVVKGSVAIKEGLRTSDGSAGDVSIGGKVMIGREGNIPDDEVPGRLVNVFSLLEDGKTEEAKKEIDALSKKFPESQYIRELRSNAEKTFEELEKEPSKPEVR